MVSKGCSFNEQSQHGSDALTAYKPVLAPKIGLLLPAQEEKKVYALQRSGREPPKVAARSYDHMP